MAYRRTRNIEASLHQYIEEQLISGSWSNVSVVQTFSRVYSLPVGGDSNKAVICIRSGATAHDKVEISSNSTRRTVPILIDIFAANDGQKLDLKDFLIAQLKSGCPYYEYTISGGSIDTKTQNGRIRVLNITDEPIDDVTPKNELEPHDRWRQLLTLDISLGQVEI